MSESQMRTLEEIEDQVETLARRIGASGYNLPTYGTSRDHGYPHVEVKDGLYHYVIMERGQELVRRSSPGYEDLLYWVFRDITHSLAFAYELKHRVQHQDSRRIAFPRQIRLMEQVSPAMSARLSAEMAEFLVRAPYHDNGL